MFWSAPVKSEFLYQKSKVNRRTERKKKLCIKEEEETVKLQSVEPAFNTDALQHQRIETEYKKKKTI